MINKISYRLVFNRKNKLNGEGKALIQVELYQNKRKIYISTHIYVFPYQWDNKKRLIKSHPQMELLNRMLDEFILSLQWKELQSWKKGIPVSLSLFRHEAAETENAQLSFSAFGRKWVESSSKKENTKKNLMTTMVLIEEFSSGLSFNEINYSFLLHFEHFMRQEKGYNVNTVAKHMKHLRAVVNEAVRYGYMSADSHPFREYRIRTGKYRHSFLLPEELEKLERLELTGCDSRLEHSLHAFLFCCYTGLRYSDFTHLSARNFCILDGKRWLIFKTVKTDVEISIPLYLLFQGKALHLLNRYKDNLNRFFMLKPNSSVNKDLVKIGMLARVKKHFSFHSARHTNATLLVYGGVQITTVQKLLGHRNVNTTQGYSEIFSDSVIKDLKRCKF